MKIGIDKINFFTSDLYVDMGELALARNEEPGKYLIGIGQSKQAVIRNSQDSVTLAANAATEIVDQVEREKIDLILFGTESGVDNSKSAAIYLQHLLNINQQASGVELKQACFGLTAGIRLALGHVMMNPESRVLVIGSDIARYGLKTSGEPTQGGGAVAAIISANPRIIELDTKSTHLTRDIMDFWRPLNRDEALVDGKYSSEEFIEFFKETFTAYQNKYAFDMNEVDSLIFHLPYTKMGLKALKAILSDFPEPTQEKWLANFEHSRKLNREVGNLYTGSLYLSLISLLTTAKLSAGSKIGFFSYGSGAEAEFFIGTLVENYQSMLDTRDLELLDQRHQVSVAEYEQIYQSFMRPGVDDFKTDYKNDSARFVLKGQVEQQRIYGEVE